MDSVIITGIMAFAAFVVGSRLGVNEGLRKGFRDGYRDGYVKGHSDSEEGVYHDPYQ